MNQTIFNIRSAIRYAIVGKHRKGYGVHSPFVFHFLNFVLFEKKPYYCYAPIENIRRGYLDNDKVVDLPSLGTGMARSCRVKDIAKSSLKSPKYAQLLFRIALFSEAKTIVELGTCLGLTTVYMSMANLKAKVYTFEGAPALCTMANSLFKRVNCSQIKLIEGNIEDSLPLVLSKLDVIDMAFIDANHTYEATISYFDAISKKCGPNSIVVLDDIHWSEGMQRAWNEIKEREEVHVDIDIYGMGILFFNTDLQKQSYVVTF